MQNIIFLILKLEKHLSEFFQKFYKFNLYLNYNNYNNSILVIGSFIYLKVHHKSKHITFNQKNVAKKEYCIIYAETKKNNCI